MPDFELARVEFVAQANSLKDLIGLVDAATAAEMRPEYALLNLPTISSGGKNTMAAASIVLLAAHFEEYIRQQVQEYGRFIMGGYDSMSDADREHFVDNYWRGGMGQLGRIRPKGDPLWFSLAENELKSLLAFPIGGDVSAFVSKLISEHENNMRWETIVDLAGRVRVKKLGEKMYNDGALKDALGSSGVGDFPSLIKNRLNDFYNLRNGIVHSISQSSGVGFSIFSEWAAFLEQFALDFERALVRAAAG
ncbi:MAG: HEPN domain-containing protein [Dyella sp.]|uniref:HEPN domain-containing protein n=1 Tax=Dyella sp. TaxID=1869338 RepID=UPI003F7E370B